MRSRFPILFLMLTFGIILILQGSVFAATPSSPTPEIAAEVNEEQISYQELNNEFLARTRVPFDMVQDNPQAQHIRKQVLEQLIDGKLLIQEAKRQQLTVPADMVEERFKNIRERFPSEEAFNQALNTRGLTPDELKQDIREGLLRQEILNKEILEKVSITPEETKNFFQAHKEDYAQEDEVKARHILIKVAPDASPEEEQKAKEQANTVLSKAKKGEDFAELAKQYSEDSSKEQGGDLGYFSRGKMVKPFEESAFNLKTGEISDLVKSEFGYHIIKVEDKKEGKPLSYEEAEDQVKEDLTREKAVARYQEYVAGLRQKADITTHLN